MFKKWWFYALLAFALIAIMAILQYRSKGKVERNNSLLSLIPSTSHAVVVLNSNRIYSSFETEIIKNPFFFSDLLDRIQPRDTASSGTNYFELIGDFKIGYRDTLVYYQTEKAHNFIASIGDQEKLERYLLDSMAQRFVPLKNKNGTTFYSEEDQLYISWDDKRLLLSYFETLPSTSMNPHGAVFSTTNQWCKSDSTIANAINNEYDILYWAQPPHSHFTASAVKHVWSTINFEEGAILMDGQVLLSKAFVMQTETQAQTDQEAIIHLEMDARLIQILGLEYHKTNQLPIDSILADNGFTLSDFSPLAQAALDLRFYGYDTLINTFTSYEYDDDFNEVEIKKIKKVPYPLFEINLKSSDSLLFNKLLSKNIIVRSKNGYKINAPVDFPILLAKNEDQFIAYTTAKPSEFSVRNSAELNVQVDFIKLQQLHQNLPYLTIPFVVSSLEGGLKPNGKGSYDFKTTLQFRDKDLHALLSIINMFQPQEETKASI